MTLLLVPNEAICRQQEACCRPHQLQQMQQQLLQRPPLPQDDAPLRVGTCPWVLLTSRLSFDLAKK